MRHVAFPQWKWIQFKWRNQSHSKPSRWNGVWVFSPVAAAADDLNGDDVIPKPCAVFPCALGWDGVILLWTLSLFIVFSNILSNRALMLHVSPPSALRVIGLPPFPLFHGAQLWNRNMANKCYSSSQSFVDLMLFLCYTISALPFALTSVSWDSKYFHGC